MYLRAVQALVDPSRLDEVIRYVEEHVRRTAKEQPGNRGLAMAVDRAAGRCAVVTFWDDKEAEQAGDTPMRSLRDAGAERFRAAFDVTYAEVLAMHIRQLPQPGNWNRVSMLDMAPADIDAALETFHTSTLPALDAIDGFCAATLSADRERGRAIAVTTWRDHDALTASDERANTLREEVRDKTHGVIAGVMEMEIVVSSVTPTGAE